LLSSSRRQTGKYLEQVQCGDFMLRHSLNDVSVKTPIMSKDVTGDRNRAKKDPRALSKRAVSSAHLYRVGSAFPIWIAALALVMALGVGWYLLPLSDGLERFRNWIIGLGSAGILIFVMTYAVGALVLAPEAVLTIVAGYAYGFWGLPIVLVAATIGASLAFLITRHLGRDKLRWLFEDRRKYAAIDTAIGEDGWKIVILLRLSPLIPFNLQNYLLGLTRIPFPRYVAATFFGIIPGTAFYTYLGVVGNAIGDHGGARWAFLGIGFLAASTVINLVTRKARAILRHAGLDSGRGDASGGK
jgi:uncharacterized membrane protein YdjX (TVP38/TMEM64 family)